MSSKLLSPQQVTDSHRDGYVIVPDFFSATEIEKLYGIATSDTVVKENALDLNDQSGKENKIDPVVHAREDVYSMLLRSERMVNNAAKY
jgi:hypothetical protein